MQKGGVDLFSNIHNTTYGLRQLSVVTITRPNDVTAYAVGDVYGNQLDATVQIGNVGQAGDRVRLSMTCVQQRSPADAALTLCPYVFTVAPSAVSDNSGVSLSDADIAAMPNIAVGTSSPFIGRFVSQNMTFQQNVAAQLLNMTAGAAGRRPAGLPGTFELVLSSSTVWVQFVVSAAYTPLANEVMQLYPTVVQLP